MTNDKTLDPQNSDTSAKRFRIAFSFTGEKRGFVEEVATIVAAKFGSDQILYDKFHEAEFSRPDLGIRLPDLYHDNSDLIVVVICPDYDKKDWTGGLEWRAIHDLVKKRRDDGIMLCRFEYAEVKGLYSSAGFMDLDHKTPREAAHRVLERLALNEGKPRDHFIKEVKPSASSELDGPIPAPPDFYAQPDYLASHDFVGRDSDLQTIDDWADAADAHPVLLFEAIGGTGKSMLAWRWVNHHAQKVRKDWAGRYWYSFYERGGVMIDFVRHAVAYIRGVPAKTLNERKMADLAEELLRHLREMPYLFILDGLERVLVAYNRIDAAQLADDKVDVAGDQIADRDPCSAIRPDDDDFLRRLAAAAPSKILITTRLTPSSLLNPSRQAVPGVRRETLKGLRPPDAEKLLKSQGVRGDSDAIQRYLVANCDCHPLVTGVLAGLINDYTPDRGNFDAWVSDAGSLGGAGLNLAHLDLKQRKNHILEAGIRALGPDSRRLLSTLSLVSQGVDYETLQALNPHLPPMPKVVEEPAHPEKSWDWEYLSDEEKGERQAEYQAALVRYQEYQAVLRTRRESAECRAAPRKLQETVRDLEKRGLLQYDHQKKRHDLHPVVRGVASGRLDAEERERYGSQVIDHFNAMPHNPYEEAETWADVEMGLQVVRTLIQLGHSEQAIEEYGGSLSDALFFNLEAYAEALSLLYSLFQNDLKIESIRLVPRAAYLSNDIGIALGRLDLYDKAIAATEISLRLTIEVQDWIEALTRIRNITHLQLSLNRIASAHRCGFLSLDLASSIDNDLSQFMARLSCMNLLRIQGLYKKAASLWDHLDVMGREWPRVAYRPGNAELVFAWLRFEESGLDGALLDKAETLARDGKNRSAIAEIHSLRGRWRLERGEWEPAIESLTEAVRMNREVGRTHAWTETHLALARMRGGRLTDARAEAERLSALKDKAHLPLAELWFAIGDHKIAVEHAVAAYKGAWADGEPFVRRWELNKAIDLLKRLGEPIPKLPPYDPAKDPPFAWEAEVEQIIARLKAEKAQKEAKNAAKAKEEQS